MLTLLVQDDDVAAGEVDGVRSTEAGDYIADGQQEFKSARRCCAMTGDTIAEDGRVNLRPPPTTITLCVMVAMLFV